MDIPNSGIEVNDNLFIDIFWDGYLIITDNEQQITIPFDQILNLVEGLILAKQKMKENQNG